MLFFPFSFYFDGMFFENHCNYRSNLNQEEYKVHSMQYTVYIQKEREGNSND